MLKKILVAIVDSSKSQSVLAAGLTLAEKFDAQCLRLHTALS
jgi:hypothetical protein